MFQHSGDLGVHPLQYIFKYLSHTHTSHDVFFHKYLEVFLGHLLLTTSGMICNNSSRWLTAMAVALSNLPSSLELVVLVQILKWTHVCWGPIYIFIYRYIPIGPRGRSFIPDLERKWSEDKWNSFLDRDQKWVWVTVYITYIEIGWLDLRGFSFFKIFKCIFFGSLFVMYVGYVLRQWRKTESKVCANPVSIPWGLLDLSVDGLMILKQHHVAWQQHCGAPERSSECNMELIRRCNLCSRKSGLSW